jgi:glucose 1-dehydrogenase
MEPSTHSTIDLTGHTVIVTGGSSGIGAGIALGFASAGANIVVNYAGSREGAEKTVKEIENLGAHAFAHQADVSREEDVQALFRAAVNRWGTVDILVNNAGIQKDAPFLDMTLEDWNKVISVNLTGSFLCAREAAREFVRRGPTERSKALGKIVFISSVHEVIPWAKHANYAATKGGIMLLMKSMAQELGPRRIRVNSISPGAIKTPINRSAWETPEAEADLLKLIPYNRVGVTADVAKAAVWLASDDSDYVHGASLYVDGGMMLYPGFAEGG